MSIWIERSNNFLGYHEMFPIKMKKGNQTEDSINVPLPDEV